IIDTIPFQHSLDAYAKLLKIHGTLSIVGAFFSLNPDFSDIIRKGKKIQGSNTAGTKLTKEYLQFCSKYGNEVLPDIEIVTTLEQVNNSRDRLVKSLCR